MKSFFFILSLVAAVSLAAPRAQRQVVNCVDPFKNVPSPCQNNPTNQVYFPHPTDVTKFLQCDIYNRMYIIQCPAGEEYEISLTSCKPKVAVTDSTTLPTDVSVTTLAPVTAAPVTAAPVTAAPVTAAPVTAAPVTAAPVTAAPVTAGPVTAAPITEAPVTVTPVTAAPLTAAPVTAAPITAAPVTITPVTTTPINPCTAAALSRGQQYFAVADKNSFIECDLTGNANLLNCPVGLVWEQGLLSCMYPINSGVAPVRPTNNLSGDISNPCTAQAISTGHFFFAHPVAGKFIQCDLWGQVFVVDCPVGLLWNADQQTCYGAGLGKK